MATGRVHPCRGVLPVVASGVRSGAAAVDRPERGRNRRDYRHRRTVSESGTDLLLERSGTNDSRKETFAQAVRHGAFRASVFCACRGTKNRRNDPCFGRRDHRSVSGRTAADHFRQFPDHRLDGKGDRGEGIEQTNCFLSMRPVGKPTLLRRITHRIGLSEITSSTESLFYFLLFLSRKPVKTS